MEIIIILLLILLNGLLSMSEIAIVSSRKSRLETDVKKGSVAAEKVLKMAEKPEGFLSTVQIGITLIGILTGLYSGDTLADDLGRVIAKISFLEPCATGIAKVIIVVLVTYVTLIFGELFPKRIGMSAAEKTAKIVVAPMNFLSKIMMPFVVLLSSSTRFLMRMFGVKNSDDSKVTEDEIKAIIQEGTEDGEIQEVEQDIVERVFTLSDRKVGSIMTHRSDLVWLDINDDNATISEIVKENLYNVYPVANEDLEDLLGVVYLKDLFGHIDQPDFNIKEMLHPALYFPENLSVYAALDQMRQSYVKYGLVTDEFGEIQGIVTLKDIMIALLGSLPEVDEEQEIVAREDGGWLVDGQCSFYDFLAHFDREDWYAQYSYNTISGLILELLEHIPKTGETLVWKEFRLEIVDMDGARIDKILVHREEKQEAAKTEEEKREENN